jgi:hypothetical protein
MDYRDHRHVYVWVPGVAVRKPDVHAAAARVVPWRDGHETNVIA